MKIDKCNTCIHSQTLPNGKNECDISHFEVDSVHCASCVSYENMENFQVCDNCKELVSKDCLNLIGNEYICEDCINNGYGQ